MRFRRPVDLRHLDWFVPFLPSLHRTT
jgi:hypothetical protein